jgi:hypothetical protein
MFDPFCRLSHSHGFGECGLLQLADRSSIFACFNRVIITLRFLVSVFLRVLVFGARSIQLVVRQALEVLNHGGSCGFNCNGGIGGAIGIAAGEDKLHHVGAYTLSDPGWWQDEGLGGAGSVRLNGGASSPPWKLRHVPAAVPAGVPPRSQLRHRALQHGVPSRMSTPSRQSTFPSRLTSATMLRPIALGRLGARVAKTPRSTS